MSQLDHLIGLIERSGLPEPRADYPFHPDREWRLTLAWPDQKIAVYYIRTVKEVSLSKLDEAQILGWMVLLVDDTMVTSGRVIHYLKRAFRLKEERDACEIRETEEVHGSRASTCQGW